MTWLLFAVVLTLLLAVDIWLHRAGHGQSRRVAIVWSVVSVSVGLLFAGVVLANSGVKPAQDYLAAFLLEKSLSLDNLFVFYIIFHSLKIRKEHQAKVLTWGILGALVFRAAFIFGGVAAIERWEWIVYVFGGVLFLASIRTFLEHPNETEESKLVYWLARHLPVSKQRDVGSFVVRENGRLKATALLVALLAAEITDVVFAIDSVPAALSITRNELIVYSSNAFAIVGLRALYLVLAHTIAHLKYLHYGLSAVLAFAAFKLVVHEWLHVPSWLSIAIIVGCITVSVVASLRAEQGQTIEEPPVA